MAEDFVLDFGGVEYLSSIELGRLLVRSRKVAAEGGRLVLRNVAPQVYEIIKITKLEKNFEIHFREPLDDPPPS
jgi:anti-anti-sigma factor